MLQSYQSYNSFQFRRNSLFLLIHHFLVSFLMTFVGVPTPTTNGIILLGTLSFIAGFHFLPQFRITRFVLVGFTGLEWKRCSNLIFSRSSSYIVWVNSSKQLYASCHHQVFVVLQYSILKFQHMHRY